MPLAAVKCSLLRARKPRGPGPDRDPQGAARCWAWVSRGSCQPLGRGTGTLQAVLWAEGPRPHRCSSAGGSESSCAPSSAEARLGLGGVAPALAAVSLEFLNPQPLVSVFPAWNGAGRSADILLRPAPTRRPLAELVTVVPMDVWLCAQRPGSFQ